MSRKQKKPITQCERCKEIYCKQINDCARKEVNAIARGEIYICRDFEEMLTYHDRLAA